MYSMDIVVVVIVVLLLSILHEQSFRHVIVKNDSIECGSTTILPSTKESFETKLSNDISCPFPSQKGIPSTADIIINTITIAHDGSKE